MKEHKYEKWFLTWCRSPRQDKQFEQSIKIAGDFFKFFRTAEKRGAKTMAQAYKVMEEKP